MTVDLYQTPLRYGAAYDELSTDGVTPRPHWAHLILYVNCGETPVEQAVEAVL